MKREEGAGGQKTRGPQLAENSQLTILLEMAGNKIYKTR